MEKTIDTIYKEMLETFQEASGYLPHASCDLAVRLYAAAAQIQGLFHQALWVLDQSFPQTAQGTYLDQHASLRGLNRAVATRASGVLRFGISSAATGDLKIQKGAVCMTEQGTRFLTTEDAVLPAGSLYVDVPAQAVEPGQAGNAAAGTITIMAAMPAGIRACTNPEAFHGGDDQESDELLRQRLMDSFRRLPNGANAAYYEQTALSFPGVAAARAVGRPRGVGSVDVYVAAEGGVPDSELLSDIAALLQSRREISVDLQVLAPETAAVDIALELRPAAGVPFSQARADADAVLRGAFTGALLGKEISLAFLGDLIYHLDSVDNYRFTLPTADLPAQDTTLPTLGSVTITEWRA